MNDFEWKIYEMRVQIDAALENWQKDAGLREDDELIERSRIGLYDSLYELMDLYTKKT